MTGSGIAVIQIYIRRQKIEIRCRTVITKETEIDVVGRKTGGGIDRDIDEAGAGKIRQGKVGGERQERSNRGARALVSSYGLAANPIAH